MRKMGTERGATRGAACEQTEMRVGVWGGLRGKREGCEKKGESFRFQAKGHPALPEKQSIALNQSS